MNLITIIFSSCIHIILVLIMEGIFLFIILMPIINNLVIDYIATIQNTLNKYINPNTPAEEYWIENPDYSPKIDEFIVNPAYDNKKPYWIKNPKYDGKNYEWIKNPDYDDKNPYWIQNPAYNNYWIKNPKYGGINIDLFTPGQKTILRAGVVDESSYINFQKYIPYIVYVSILIGLIILIIILIVISNKYDIKIDYKFVIINSIIVLFIIGGYMGAFIWYSVFNYQPYNINIEKQIMQTMLDVYKTI